MVGETGELPRLLSWPRVHVKGQTGWVGVSAAQSTPGAPECRAGGIPPFTGSSRAAIVRTMAILKIARMGHPVLRRRAEPVDDPTAPEIARVIADMLETLADADGAGLAGPQVYTPKRIVIFLIGEERTTAADDDIPQALQVLINPIVEPLTEETALGWEGCLSVPGLVGAVPRFTSVRYTGTTPEGVAVDRMVSGFHARVVQHECDHLDGILYPMRMTDLSLLGFAEEMSRATAPLADDEEEDIEAAE